MAELEIQEPPGAGVVIPEDQFKWTERIILDALGVRYGIRPGTPTRWVFATHVRTATGFDATNTIDAVALDLWPSAGHFIHGFEVKCSRGDWLNEIKPRVIKKGYTHGPYGTFPETVVPPIIRPPLEKSAKARELCDTFTVVAPPDVVKPDELPDGWGWFEARQYGGGARIYVVQSPAAPAKTSLEKHDLAGSDMPRKFALSIMRQVGRL